LFEPRQELRPQEEKRKNMKEPLLFPQPRKIGYEKHSADGGEGDAAGRVYGRGRIGTLLHEYGFKDVSVLIKLHVTTPAKRARCFEFAYGLRLTSFRFFRC
jgi:hypothetical protein